MRLYHFTNIAHLASILRVGYLDTTDSNLRVHQSPEFNPVLWLTSNPSNDKSNQAWSTNVTRATNPTESLLEIANKTRIRFSVEKEISRSDPRYGAVPLCYCWDWWSRCIGRDGRFAQAMKDSGGDWRSFYVFPSKIRSKDWLRIEDTEKGEVLWDGELTQAGEDLLAEHEQEVAVTPLYRFTQKGFQRQ